MKRIIILALLVLPHFLNAQRVNVVTQGNTSQGINQLSLISQDPSIKTYSSPPPRFGVIVNGDTVRVDIYRDSATKQIRIYNQNAWVTLSTSVTGTLVGTLAQLRADKVSYSTTISSDYGGGTWYLDLLDNTTPDNTGLCYRDANGRAHKRVYGNYVGLEWFGVLGSDPAVNTATLKRCLYSIGIEAGTYVQLQPQKSVLFPKGILTVLPNALAPDSLNYSGVKFWAESGGGATIKMVVPLDSAAKEYYLCKTNGGMDGTTFENINFTTDYSRAGYKNSLFNFVNNPDSANWRGRYTQGLTFTNCFFSFWDRMFVLQGKDLNSEFNLSNCRVSQIQESFMEATNSQALNILLYGTHIELYCKDVFYIREGGEFHVFGGSYINCSEAQMATVANPNKTIPSSTQCNFFRCVAENILSDGATWTPSSMFFTIDGIRTELRSYGKLLDVRRLNPLSVYTPTISFSNSNISDLRQDYIVPDSIPSMVLRSGAKAYFNNCVMPNRQVQLIRDADRSIDVENNDVPEINLNNCLGNVHPNDWIKYSYTGVTNRYPYGRANISNHRWLRSSSGSSLVAPQESYNCNTYSYGSSLQGNSIAIKKAIFRPQTTISVAIYTGDTISGGKVTNPSFTISTPATLRIPIGSMITSVRFVSLNGGSPQVHTYVATFAGVPYTIYSGGLSEAVTSQVDINKPVTMLNQTITLSRTDAANSSADIIGWFEIDYL